MTFKPGLKWHLTSSYYFQVLHVEALQLYIVQSHLETWFACFLSQNMHKWGCYLQKDRMFSPSLNSRVQTNRTYTSARFRPSSHKCIFKEMQFCWCIFTKTALVPSNSPFTLLFCCVFPCGSTQQCSINNDILLLENIKCHHSVFSKASSLILLCILAIMNLREVWTIFRSIWKKYDRALFSDVSPLDINHFWHSLDHVCTSIFSNSTVSSSLVASEMAF